MESVLSRYQRLTVCLIVIKITNLIFKKIEINILVSLLNVQIDLLTVPIAINIVKLNKTLNARLRLFCVVSLL